MRKFFSIKLVEKFLGGSLVILCTNCHCAFAVLQYHGSTFLLFIQSIYTMVQKSYA